MFKNNIFYALLTSLSFSLLLLLISFFFPIKYKSDSLLAITEGSNSSSNALSDIGGIARLAGVTLGSTQGGIAKNALILETIKSREFLKNIIDKNSKILPNLVAVKKYDSKTKKIFFNENIYLDETEEWVKEKPSYLEAHKIYLKTIDVYQIPQSGFISISVSHKSPIFSKLLIEVIISEINLSLREQDQEKSRNALDFLLKESLNEAYKPVQQSINNIALQKMSKLVLAEITEDYALQIIDKPYLPEEKHSPNRFLIFQIGFTIALILSLFKIYLFPRLRISNEI